MGGSGSSKAAPGLAAPLAAAAVPAVTFVRPAVPQHACRRGRTPYMLAVRGSVHPTLALPLLLPHHQGLDAYTSLEKLSLASLGLKSLKGLPTQLTSLAVNDNNLTGAALANLAPLTRLKRLDLAGEATHHGLGVTMGQAVHAGSLAVAGASHLRSTKKCLRCWRQAPARGAAERHGAAGNLGLPAVAVACKAPYV